MLASSRSTSVLDIACPSRVFRADMYAVVLVAPRCGVDPRGFGLDRYPGRKTPLFAESTSTLNLFKIRLAEAAAGWLPGTR